MAGMSMDDRWFLNSKNFYTERKNNGELSLVSVENNYSIFRHLKDDGKISYSLCVDDNFVGNVSGYCDDNNHFVILVTVVDTNCHGKGYATYLYKAILKLHSVLISDFISEMSNAGRALWASLKRRYAVETVCGRNHLSIDSIEVVR